MEVVNKLIDMEEALVNQFDHDGKQDAGTSGAAVIPAQSSVSDLQGSSRRTGGDPRRSTSRCSMRCSTAPARSTKGEPTQSVSASSSRGRSMRRGLQTI
jgi:hypothetical protein